MLLSLDRTVRHENHQSWNRLPGASQESPAFRYRIRHGCIYLNHLPGARRAILAAFLIWPIQCAEGEWTRHARGEEARETICRFNVASDLCRSLHVPSDSVGCICTLFRGRRCIPEPGSVQGGLAEEGEGVARGSIARATDLSSAVVRFIHRGPSRSRLRSRRPPFVLFLPFSPWSRYHAVAWIAVAWVIDCEF